MSEPLRLHIGGRERRQGWTVFNIEPGPHVDHVGDCRDLSQFADGSAAEIYASHVFEHLGYFEELPRVLAECFRVLTDAGCLRIIVPNLEILCRLFLRLELEAEQRFHIMRMMFGGQMDTNDFHKVGLTFEFLDDFLKLPDLPAFRRSTSSVCSTMTAAFRSAGISSVSTSPQ